MKRHLAAVAVIGLAAAIGAASGCGSDVTSPEGAVSQADITVSPAHYYRVRPYPRWCGTAPCSGFFLVAIDGKATEGRAAPLDFSALGDDDGLQRAVHEAPMDELLLYGRFAEPPGREAATFVVRGVLRGMPGVSAPADDAFYTVAPRDPPIACFAPPCDNLVAKRMGSDHGIDFASLDVSPAGGMPNVDRTWLADRVTHHGAVVAGHLRDGTVYRTGTEHVLQADQVFVRLPDAGGICPLVVHHCPDGEVPTYTRGLDRCRTFDVCVSARRACLPELPARCAPGYTLSRWATSTPACSAAVCDPDFLAE